jgi:hypothetical protein
MGPVLLLLLVSTVFSMINILSVVPDYSGIAPLCSDWRCPLIVFFYRLAAYDRQCKFPRKPLNYHIFHVMPRSLQSIERSDCGFGAGIANDKLYTLAWLGVLANILGWVIHGLHLSILSVVPHHCDTPSL